MLNKVLPAYFRDPAAAAVAGTLRERAGRAWPAAVPTDPALHRRVLGEIADSFLNFGVVARREAEQQAELRPRPEVLATVPLFDADMFDMAGLLRLGRRSGADARGAYHG